MEITMEKYDLAVVIFLAGSLDALTAENLLSFVATQIGMGEYNVIIDMSQVDFMSSAGLRAILALVKESRQRGGDLFLVEPQAGVLRILKLSGFANILKTFPTVDQAVADFSHRAPQ